MAPIAISSPDQTYAAIDSIKASLSRVSVKPASINEDFDLTSYSHFDSTPAIGTEFRAYSPDGKPVLSIRDILGNEDRLKALGRLV